MAIKPLRRLFPSFATTLQRTVRSCKISVHFISALWGLTVLIGFFCSVDYQLRPSRCAACAQAPVRWPNPMGLTRTDGQPILVMFVHPQCPCSRASLTELADVVSRTPVEMKTYIVFCARNTSASSIEKSETWRQAHGIPGAIVERDTEGQLSLQFGATTSGSVVMYDGIGHLAFAGGLTASRGHVGKCSATETIAAQLQGQLTSCQFHSTFGCPISSMPVSGGETVQ